VCVSTIKRPNCLMRKIILAQLYSELQPPNAEPFAIEVLAGALQPHLPDWRIELAVVNPATELDSTEQLIQRARQTDCSVLGLSIPQGTLGLALEILGELKPNDNTQNAPLVVLGHALPTHAPDVFLNSYPSAIAVQGWGEDAVVALLGHMDEGPATLETVPGIAYRVADKMVTNPPTYRIHPFRTPRIDPGRYFARVEASRGCHYGSCTFCTRPPGPKDYWSRIEADDVLAACEDLKNLHVTRFTFTDEDFIGTDPHGAIEIARGLRAVAGMQFSISVRADSICSTPDVDSHQENSLSILADLAEAGLCFVYVGAESFSDSQLVRFGKGSRASKMLQAVNSIESLGIPMELGFMLFDPFVTVPELRENLASVSASGAWRYLSNPFSEMRVQKDSPYELMLKNRGLLGEFDANMLSYKWSYQHADVAALAGVCAAWHASFHPVLRLLRNLERTKQHRPTIHRALLDFRQLDLDVLGWLLSDAQPGHARNVVLPPAFSQSRLHLATELLQHLRAQMKAPEEHVLLQELESFAAPTA